MNLSHIHAIVPALDCESTIGAVVEGIRRQGLEVTVVDDGSADNTAQVAKVAGAHVLRHPLNQGKGHALVTGFRWALDQGKKAVLTLDADGQHDPQDIPSFLAHADKDDLLIGQRRITLEVMPLASFIGNCVSIFWISLFCGRLLPDTQCGFRLYSRRLLTKVWLQGGRFETETDLLIRASRLGLRLRWVPIRTIYGPRDLPHPTHFRNTSDALRVISVVLRSLDFPRKTK